MGHRARPSIMNGQSHTDLGKVRRLLLRYRPALGPGYRRLLRPYLPFLQLICRQFPELAGGQLEEWKIGTKKTSVSGTKGGSVTKEKPAYFTKICMALAIHYAGTGTVALDRRAPDTQWLSFEDSGEQYHPCVLCHGRDGHYALQNLEKPKGESETILLCPHKGTCPKCGEVQAAFLYGGHRQECDGNTPSCHDCKQQGFPAGHKPLDLVSCKTFVGQTEREFMKERRKQTAVNKAFESLLARAIASKGKDFAPYLAARRMATTSKAALNSFYQAHEELGDFADLLRTMAPGSWMARARIRWRGSIGWPKVRIATRQTKTLKDFAILGGGTRHAECSGIWIIKRKKGGDADVNEAPRLIVIYSRLSGEIAASRSYCMREQTEGVHGLDQGTEGGRGRTRTPGTLLSYEAG